MPRIVSACERVGRVTTVWAVLAAALAAAAAGAFLFVPRLLRLLG